MEHFTFGRNNGLRVSALALGAGNFGSRWGHGADPDDIPKIFGKFADAGGSRTIRLLSGYLLRWVAIPQGSPRLEYRGLRPPRAATHAAAVRTDC